MVYFLQFCGFSDPLQLFYLEQRQSADQAQGAGPAYGGFRPVQLDELLAWALDTARGRQWDGEAIQRTVLDVWMDRAELIRQWQMRLRDEPADRLLVAALGTRQDWDRQCEQLLRT